jgi:hypothetical protein
MKIEIPQSSQLTNHPLTSPVFHSQEYVESFGLYHNNSNNGANAASTHNGGYHSDVEHHHNNKQKDDSEQNSENVQQNQPSPQANGEKTIQSKNTSTNDKDSKSAVSVNDNTTKSNARSK